MKFIDFKQITTEIWDSYLRLISDMKIELIGYNKLFPNIGLCTETTNYFIFELFGLNESFSSLTIKGHEEPSIIKYLHQFNSSQSQVSSTVVTGRAVLRRALFARKPDYQILENRFGTNFRSSFPYSVTCNSGDGPSITFEDLEFCVMDNCLLINRYNNFFRIKSIIFLIVISKKISKKNTEKFY